jgi:hypothetical protein
MVCTYAIFCCTEGKSFPSDPIQIFSAPTDGFGADLRSYFMEEPHGAAERYAVNDSGNVRRFGLPRERRSS